MLGFTAKRVAGLLAAKMGADYLMDRDESGHTRVGRWLGAHGGPAGLYALSARGTCRACGFAGMEHGAITCREHNAVLVGFSRLSNDLAIRHSQPVYTRDADQRGYHDLAAYLAGVLNAGHLRPPGSCPSITTAYALASQSNPVPVRVARVVDLNRRAVDFLDAATALDTGLARSITVDSGPPITTSHDPRLAAVRP